jgi:hypothetical protein
MESNAADKVRHFESAHSALDDEADDDEELYLVGTASERDALVLNALTGPIEPSESTVGQSRSIPGVRIRRVSPNVSFVFYKSTPYGQENVDDRLWMSLTESIGIDNVPQVLEQ